MKRPVLLLAVLAVLVVAVVGHTLVLAPKTSERAAVRERLAAAADEEDTLRVDLVRLQRLAAGTKVSEAELERLRSLVPDTADLASFIRALDDVAARSGVKWSSLTPGPPVAGAHGTTVGISISVGGTFFQLLRYVSALETLNRLVVIDSVTLTPAAGGAGSPVRRWCRPPSRAGSSAPGRHRSTPRPTSSRRPPHSPPLLMEVTDGHPRP